MFVPLSSVRDFLQAAQPKKGPLLTGPVFIRRYSSLFVKLRQLHTRLPSQMTALGPGMPVR